MFEINDASDVLQYNLTQVLANLKRNGIHDFTKEDVGYIKEYSSGKKEVLKFHFYTKDQWMVDKNKATTAQIIMGKHVEGYKTPLTKVRFEEVEYFVVKI